MSQNQNQNQNQSQSQSQSQSPSARCLLLSHPQARDTGDFIHRVVLPGQALARHMAVAEIQTSHPEFVRHSLQAGLLVIQMVADPVLREVMAWRSRRGLPTVYEISDDFQDFPASLHGHAFYAEPSTQALIKELASQADLLQFSSHGLRDTYAGLNSRVFVAPNQLESVPALGGLAPARVVSPVLGWAGSVGHREDARALAWHLKRWLDARPPSAGLVPPLRIMAAESVQALFKDAGLDCRFEPPGSFADYLAFLSSIDIGLAWIAPTAFAKGRSDGKYLEYASRGVVCVASREGEYARTLHHGETGYLFSDGANFIEVLDAVFDRPEERLRVRLQAHEQVAQQRLHQHAVFEKLAAYATLPNTAWVAQAARSTESGREMVSLVDDSEAAWMVATQHHSCGRLNEALSCYLGLLEKWPSFHEPWLRSAMVAQALGAPSDAQQFLQTAQTVLRERLQASI